MGIKETLMAPLFKLCGFGTCKDVGGNCYDYVEGQLSEGKEKRVRKHLKICGKCLRFMASYLAVRALGKTIHPETLTSEQKAKILEALNLKS